MQVFKIIVLVVFSISLVSCGGKEEKKKDGFSYEKKLEVSNKTKSDPNDVVITSNDAMQFNKKEIEGGGGGGGAKLEKK